MKVRPGILVLLALALLFVVIKMVPKSAERGQAKPGRSADLLGEEEGTRSRGRRGANLALEPPTVALARLEGGPVGERFAIGRNIFRYGAPKTPPMPAGQPPGGRPGAGRPGMSVGQPTPGVPLTPTPAVPPAPPKPRPPAVTVRYLGAFGPSGKTVAVFSDGAEIYDVFEGETFASQYILRRINLETVELGFVGFPDDQIEKLEVGP